MTGQSEKNTVRNFKSTLSSMVFKFVCTVHRHIKEIEEEEEEVEEEEEEG